MTAKIANRPQAPDALVAWSAFLRAHARLIDVLGEELEEAVGMPLSWYEVLLHLRAATGERLRMQDLAAAVILSRSGLTRLVDRMESAGVVTREECPSDRRGTYAALTAGGRRAFAAAQPVHAAGVQRHFVEILTPTERDALGAGLQRIIDALGGDDAIRLGGCDQTSP